MNFDESQPRPTDIAAGPPPSGGPNSRLAYCPGCGETVNSSIPICPHCGYDFPLGRVKRSRGPVFSVVADVVLIAGAAIATLGSAITIGVATVMLSRGEFSLSFLALLSAVVLAAAAIAFLRVQQVEPPP